MNGEAEVTAKQSGLVQCRICHKLIPQTQRKAVVCPRCGAAVHSRIPHSLAKTWAYLLTAMMLYIPANILPIMIVSDIAGGRADTIFSGIVSLMRSGMIPIGLIVFTASIVVPLLKMAALLILLLSVQCRWHLSALHRTRLYRLTEFVGRWSMLDIYVIMILITLVAFGALVNIETGPAATAFAAVVILTMLAAMSFDARLLWDNRDDA
ncbi:MAG: paraquat-inducible protein A [Gammaproteobacteria bacterium]